MTLEMFVIGARVNNGGWGIVVLILLFCAVVSWLRYLPYRKPKGALVECLAVVKSKRVAYVNATYGGWNFYILFVDQKGNEVELLTMEAAYGNFNEGDVGRLKYQSGTIIEFIPQKWYEPPIQID